MASNAATIPTNPPPTQMRSWRARARQGSQAQLRGPRPDGKSQRAGGQLRRHQSHRPCRAGGGVGDGEQISGWHRVTLGAEKGYDRKELVQAMREHRVTRISRASKPAPSTSVPLGIRDMQLVSESANGWKRSSAGSRPLRAAQDRHPGSPWSVGCSPSHWRLTTWSACATSCPRRHNSNRRDAERHNHRLTAHLLAHAPILDLALKLKSQ